MIVLDASAVIELVLGERLHEAVAMRVLEPRQILNAPAVLDLEVLQTLRRYERQGPARVAAGLEDFTDLNIRRHPHEPLARRIWALRHNATAYDASYLALAEALRVPLVTCDARLAAAPGHTATVELIA